MTKDEAEKLANILAADVVVSDGMFHAWVGKISAYDHVIEIHQATFIPMFDLFIPKNHSLVLSPWYEQALLRVRIFAGIDQAYELFKLDCIEAHLFNYDFESVPYWAQIARSRGWRR